jgi:polar amino acid transport system substrate-binding protein
MISLALLLVVGQAHAERILAVTEITSFSYLENGKVGGPATRLVEQTLKAAGLNDYQVTLYPWARAYDMALSEPNVLIYVIARTPEREPLFKWVGQFATMEPLLFKLASRNDIAPQSLEDASRYRVGVTRDDIRHKYLQTQGFKRLVVSAQNTDNFRKLLNGQIDLMPIEDREARQLCEEQHVDCADVVPAYPLPDLANGLYLAYSNATSDEIVERTRRAFNEVNPPEGLR